MDNIIDFEKSVYESEEARVEEAYEKEGIMSGVSSVEWDGGQCLDGLILSGINPIKAMVDAAAAVLDELDNDSPLDNEQRSLIRTLLRGAALRLEATADMLDTFHVIAAIEHQKNHPHLYPSGD